MTGEKKVDDMKDKITIAATASIQKSDGAVFNPNIKPIVTSKTTVAKKDEIVPSNGGSKVMTGNFVLMMSCVFFKFVL
jgi:hypothetical protein